MPGVPVRWEGAILTDRRGLRRPGRRPSPLDRAGRRAARRTPRCRTSGSGRCSSRLKISTRWSPASTRRGCWSTGGPSATTTTVRSAVITTRDPGSTAIELVAAAAATTYTGVRVNCSGPRPFGRVVPERARSRGRAQPSRRRPRRSRRRGRADSGLPTCSSRTTHGRSGLELTEWVRPAVVGVRRTPSATDAGVYRVALTVDIEHRARGTFAPPRSRTRRHPSPSTSVRPSGRCEPSSSPTRTAVSSSCSSRDSGERARGSCSCRYRESGRDRVGDGRQLAADGAIVIGADDAGDGTCTSTSLMPLRSARHQRQRKEHRKLDLDL